MECFAGVEGTSIEVRRVTDFESIESCLTKWRGRTSGPGRGSGATRTCSPRRISRALPGEAVQQFAEQRAFARGEVARVFVDQRTQRQCGACPGRGGVGGGSVQDSGQGGLADASG